MRHLTSEALSSSCTKCEQKERAPIRGIEVKIPRPSGYKCASHSLLYNRPWRAVIESKRVHHSPLPNSPSMLQRTCACAHTHARTPFHPLSSSTRVTPDNGFPRPTLAMHRPVWAALLAPAPPHPSSLAVGLETCSAQGVGHVGTWV